MTSEGCDFLLPPVSTDYNYANYSLSYSNEIQPISTKFKFIYD